MIKGRIRPLTRNVRRETYLVLALEEKGIVAPGLYEGLGAGVALERSAWIPAYCRISEIELKLAEISIN